MAATSRTVGGCREGPARSIGLMREVPAAPARYRPTDLGPLPRPAAWPPIGRTMDRTADDLTTASGGTKIPFFCRKYPSGPFFYTIKAFKRIFGGFSSKTGASARSWQSQNRPGRRDPAAGLLQARSAPRRRRAATGQSARVHDRAATTDHGPPASALPLRTPHAGGADAVRYALHAARATYRFRDANPLAADIRCPAGGMRTMTPLVPRSDHRHLRWTYAT